MLHQIFAAMILGAMRNEGRSVIDGKERKKCDNIVVTKILIQLQFLKLKENDFIQGKGSWANRYFLVPGYGSHRMCFNVENGFNSFCIFKLSRYHFQVKQTWNHQYCLIFNWSKFWHSGCVR